MKLSDERAAGPLLLEVQGQSDLRLALSSSRKLSKRMTGAGAVVSPEQIQDATGAGVVALGVWRVTGKGSDGEPERLAARVAWRAVVQSMSADRFGDSIPLDSINDSWLWHHAEQGYNGDGRGDSASRRERVASYLVERAARGGVFASPVQFTIGFADGRLTEFGERQTQVITLPAGAVVSSRQAQLSKRMSRLPVRRGKRGQVIERVTNCASLMLDGFRLDEAATAAGFKGRGDKSRHSSGDTFCQALRRLGFEIQGHARQSLREPAKRRAAFVAPMDGDTLTSASGDLFAVSLSDGSIEWQAVTVASVSPCEPSQNLATLQREQTAKAHKPKVKTKLPKGQRPAGDMVIYPKLAKVKRDGGVYLA